MSQDDVREDVERLKIAFGVEVLRRIAEADGVLHARELEALQSAYPAGRLRQLGFIDDEGLTEAWARAAERARDVLPRRLSHQEKLLLLGFFHTVTLSDGALDPREVREVHEAARILEIRVDELGEHLDRMTGVTDTPPPRRRR